MKQSEISPHVKVARYIPEQAMGAAKFKSRRRVVATFIPTASQRRASR